MNKKLNILIISHYFPPLNSIASLRPYSWAKYWSEMGHDVTVLTTKKEIYDNRLELNGSFKVIEVDYFGRSVVSEQKKISRTNNVSEKKYFSLKYFILKKIKDFVYYFRKKYGILAAERIPESISFWVKNATNYASELHKYYEFHFMISTYPSPSTHLIAYKLKRKYPEIKWISDYRDSWSISNYSQPGLLGIRLYEKYLEEKIIKLSNIITTVSPALVKEFKLRFPTKSVKLIENGFFPEIEEIEEIKFENEINIVYTGSFGGYRSLKFLDDFLKKLKSKDNAFYKKIHFHILGSGDEYFDNEKITYYGKVSNEMSIRYQNSAQILFLIESDKEIARGTLTGKFFEYLKTGKYIIAFGPKETFDISSYLNNLKVGTVSKIDFDSVYNSLQKFFNHSANNNENIQDFSRKKLALKILDIVEKLNEK